MNAVQVKSVSRYVRKRLSHGKFSRVRDPRSARGRRWSLASLLTATLTGMMAGARCFRGVERLTRDLPKHRRVLGIGRRVADSTLARVFSNLEDEAGLRDVLVAEIKDARRRKALEAQRLPIHTAAIDGKTLWCGRMPVADPACQPMPQTKQTYYRLHALHAVVISACTQPCIDPMLVPANTNEMGTLPAFAEQLARTYGNWLEAVTVDAGMTSAHNARALTALSLRYVMAVKGTQPALLSEIKRLCGWGEHKQQGFVREAATGWETYRGTSIRRELFRSQEIRDWPDWPSARQVWRVKQTTRTKDGRTEVFNRYFVTSLPYDRLAASQILSLVRLHWGVENGLHWTADVVMGEDTHPWCTKGQALRMLSWIRLLAYNALRFLRDRYLRTERNRRLPWVEIIDLLRDALRGATCATAGAATTTL